jgi:hypothetical protein
MQRLNVGDTNKRKVVLESVLRETEEDFVIYERRIRKRDG